MKLRHLLFVLAFLFGGMFLAVDSAEALTCAELEGSGCVSTGQCEQFQKQNSKIQCLNASDCSASDQKACWFNPDSAPGKACQAADGYCAKSCSGNDTPLAVLDCPIGSDGSQQTCCATETSVPVAAPGAGGGGGSGQTAPTGIILPSCTQDGNCTLDDIVKTGVNFATFLFGLSAALFFLVFIYGGVMYLVSFGNAAMVDRGKKALKGAVIGFLLVMSAWAIVRFVDDSLRGTSSTVTAPAASGVPASCAQMSDQGFSCQTLSGNTSQEALADGQQKGFTCHTGLCPGPVNILCCKPK